MRLLIVILIMLLLIIGMVTVVPAQSYHRTRYKPVDSKPATYQAHTRGYKNVVFIRKLKQKKQYAAHRRNVRRSERKLKPSPIYFRRS